jgi:hypothetical protein
LLVQLQHLILTLLLLISAITAYFNLLLLRLLAGLADLFIIDPYLRFNFTVIRYQILAPVLDNILGYFLNHHMLHSELLILDTHPSLKFSQVNLALMLSSNFQTEHTFLCLHFVCSHLNIN